MNKSKLFAICLTVTLMASGCANTNTNSQADSQGNESSVESITSEVSDTSEESQTSETEKAEESKELSVTLESSETVVVESKEDKPIVEKEKSVSQQKETMVIESSVEPLAVSRETAEMPSEIYIEESTEQPSEESVILESSVETSVVSEEIIENDDGIWNIISASEFEDSDFEDSEDAEEIEDESDDEEYPEIWGIVKEPCVTHEGYEIGKNVYVKIIFNDLDDDYCLIQWYDDTAELDECYVDMFEIWKEDTIPLIENGKTAGIITN